MTILSPDIDASDENADAQAAIAKTPSAFGILPGVGLTAVIAAVAFALRQIPHVSILSPIILSITIGMALHNFVGTPAIAKPGVAFSMRRLLRLAIILLGLQLTTTQLVEVGGTGLAIIAERYLCEPN